jgi:hypothetical protein
LCFHIRNLSTTLAQLFCPSQYECFWPIWLCFTCCFFLWFVCWGWHNFVVGGFRLLLYCCLDFDYFSSTMILLKRYTLHDSGQGLLCIMMKFVSMNHHLLQAVVYSLALQGYNLVISIDNFYIQSLLDINIQHLLL